MLGVPLLKTIAHVFRYTGNIAQASDSLVLTLNNDSKLTGTALAATRAMRYGRMSVELQTAWSGGVVSAAILMGQTTEEIDARVLHRTTGN